MKLYQFTCSNGNIYQLPLDLIIEDKARYAFKKNWYGLLPLFDVIKEVEQEFIIDPSLIQDWARNNMNWSDIRGYARLVHDENKINMNEEWSNPIEVSIVEMV